MRQIVVGLCLALAIGGAARAAEQAVNAELLRLHDDLRLSDSQESAWRTYATAMSPDPQTLARHRAATELLPLVPTPRRIALIEATMAADASDFQKRAAAVNAFYGQLTPGQQRIFDQDTVPSGAEAAPRP